MVRDFLDEWGRVRRRELAGLATTPRSYGAAVLATGALFGPTLAHAAAQFTRATGIPAPALAIANARLGDTITVAGLLMGEDIIGQVRAARSGARPDIASLEKPVLVLPRITFDHPQGVALDDVSPLDIARALDLPVALADWMGDVVDALTGRNKLLFRPDAGPLDTPIVREGGWAVEKYL